MKKFLKMLGLASARELAEAEEALDDAAKALAEAYTTKAEAAPAADVWADAEAATAAEAAKVPPALFEEAESESEVGVEASAEALVLTEAKTRLQKVSQAKAKAEAEADLLREVWETNNISRSLLLEMEKLNLLPAQMEQRRKDAENDSSSLEEQLKNLGI